MAPAAPPEVLRAARSLQYRDFLTVALVVPERYGFPDNWIYIHDPEVQVGRIQNFGSWSPYLVKDGRTCLGLEYFVFEGDELWTMPDDDLVDARPRRAHRLGLVAGAAVTAGYVVRDAQGVSGLRRALPAQRDTIRAWLATDARNVHPVGRNGMHRYNNADHSMVTAMLTAANITSGAGPRRLVGQRRTRLPRGIRHPTVGDRRFRPGCAHAAAAAHRGGLSLPRAQRLLGPAAPPAGGPQGGSRRWLPTVAPTAGQPGPPRVGAAVCRRWCGPSPGADDDRAGATCLGVGSAPTLGAATTSGSG